MLECVVCAFATRDKMFVRFLRVESLPPLAIVVAGACCCCCCFGVSHKMAAFCVSKRKIANKIKVR